MFDQARLNAAATGSTVILCRAYTQHLTTFLFGRHYIIIVQVGKVVWGVVFRSLPTLDNLTKNNIIEFIHG